MVGEDMTEACPDTGLLHNLFDLTGNVVSTPAVALNGKFGLMDHVTRFLQQLASDITYLVAYRLNLPFKAVTFPLAYIQLQ